MPSTSASLADQGLEGVVATSSAICDIDGIKGVLVYRGYDIHDLAQNSTFEEVVYLLWNGELPTRSQLDELKRELAANIALPAEIVRLIESFPRGSPPNPLLRTAYSALALYDPDRDDNSIEASRRKAIRSTARMGPLVAAVQRIPNGEKALEPDPSKSIAENFMYLLQGKWPDEVTARVVDVGLVLHADHELNASTFAARVTAATLSDFYSAITSALGALFGPLHGGANSGAIKMLREIGTPDKAADWVRAALGRHERIMGFGHRVYKTYDPRARELKQMSKRLGERQGDLTLFEISERIEQVMEQERHLYPNVDFYSASTYTALGIPGELFTPIFAVSRIAGWSAHVLEQYEHNRLIRPRAEYVGRHGRKYVPIEQRG
ncbi:MAG TPA: citrate/2-methylcitrate synthase [Chloroflexota bacterium]|nr:citrate/2-methylcitrate synthase [Chloroflexota bacterium]